MAAPIESIANIAKLLNLVHDTITLIKGKFLCK